MTVLESLKAHEVIELQLSLYADETPYITLNEEKLAGLIRVEEGNVTEWNGHLEKTFTVKVPQLISEFIDVINTYIPDQKSVSVPLTIRKNATEQSRKNAIAAATAELTQKTKNTVETVRQDVLNRIVAAVAKYNINFITQHSYLYGEQETLRVAETVREANPTVDRNLQQIADMKQLIESQRAMLRQMEQNLKVMVAVVQKEVLPPIEDMPEGVVPKNPTKLKLF